jgi:hypothetical protein
LSPSNKTCPTWISLKVTNGDWGVGMR